MNSLSRNNFHSRLLIVHFFLLLFSLACSLTTPPVKSTASNFIQTKPTVQSTIEAETPTPGAATCIVTAHVLQLRECGGVSCMVKDWLDQGEILTVQQKVDGWYQVTTSVDKSGWVNSKYCGGM
jgi:uncharacterized protein YgiM (DUF1202 family)